MKNPRIGTAKYYLENTKEVRAEKSRVKLSLITSLDGLDKMWEGAELYLKILIENRMIEIIALSENWSELKKILLERSANYYEYWNHCISDSYKARSFIVKDKVKNRMIYLVKNADREKLPEFIIKLFNNNQKDQDFQFLEDTLTDLAEKIENPSFIIELLDSIKKYLKSLNKTLKTIKN